MNQITMTQPTIQSLYEESKHQADLGTEVSLLALRANIEVAEELFSCASDNDLSLLRAIRSMEELWAIASAHATVFAMGSIEQTLLDLINVTYTDELESIESYQLDSNGVIKGVGIDVIGVNATKKISFEIDDDDIQLKVLNPNDVERFAIEVFAAKRGKSLKPKNCTKGLPCGGSCQSVKNVCTKGLSPEQKKLAEQARRLMKKGQIGPSVDIPQKPAPVAKTDTPVAKVPEKNKEKPTTKTITTKEDRDYSIPERSTAPHPRPAMPKHDLGISDEDITVTKSSFGLQYREVTVKISDRDEVKILARTDPAGGTSSTRSDRSALGSSYDEIQKSVIAHSFLDGNNVLEVIPTHIPGGYDNDLISRAVERGVLSIAKGGEDVLIRGTDGTKIPVNLIREGYSFAANNTEDDFIPITDPRLPSFTAYSNKGPNKWEIDTRKFDLQKSKDSSDPNDSLVFLSVKDGRLKGPSVDEMVDRAKVTSGRHLQSERAFSVFEDGQIGKQALSKDAIKKTYEEEDSFAKQVGKLEDSLVGRNPQKGVVRSYKSYQEEAAGWAKQLGLDDAANGFSAEQTASHDVGHPIVREMLGLSSDQIRKQLGGVAGKGTTTLVAEEAIVNAVEHLSRGDSPENSVTNGVRVARVLSRGSDFTEKQREAVRSPKFVTELVKMVDTIYRNDNYNEYMALVRKANRVSETAQAPGDDFSRTGS